METIIECTGSGYSRSCFYKNIYYKDKNFWVLSVQGKRLPFLEVRIGIRVGAKIYGGIDPKIIYNYSPLRREFKSYTDLERFVRETAAPRVIPGLTLFFKQPWHLNIGHALFDGLYPAYLALTRFPPRHLLPFRSLIGLDNVRCEDCWAEDVSSRFGGLGIIKESILKVTSVHRWFVFEELVMGNGDMCQRCVQPSFQLAGGVELDGSRLFRDRMYKQHGLILPVMRRNHSAEKRHSRIPLKAYIIHNKRFTTQDEYEIKAAISEINNYAYESLNKSNKDTIKLKWPLVIIAYINYSHVKAQNKHLAPFNATRIDSRIPTYELTENDFMTQLNLLRDMDIHITGPGTGQMYQTFLADGSVTINLGGLTTDLFPNSTSPYASFMEQYMTAGIPYIKGLYYPINERRHGIKKNELVKLIRKAARLIFYGFSIPVKPYSNLAADGQLFTEMCAKDIKFCRPVTVRAPNHETSCFNLWAEEMVHEQRQWAPEGFINGMRNVSCPLNRALLQTLRLKYGIHHDVT